MPAKKEPVKLECAVCGGGFCVQPYRANTAKTCSPNCRQVHNARQQTGDSQRYTGEGRTYVKLKGRHMHRVIAEEKLGRALLPGEIVHHIDGDKRNNHPDNLEVITQSEHIKKHLADGSMVRPNGIGKLTENQVREIKSMSGSFAEIGRAYGVCGPTIEAIKKGRTWKHVTI